MEPQQLSHHDSPAAALCAHFTHEHATTPQTSCVRFTARLHTSNVQIPRRSRHHAEPQEDLMFRVGSCVVACRRCHNTRRAPCSHGVHHGCLASREHTRSLCPPSPTSSDTSTRKHSFHTPESGQNCRFFLVKSRVNTENRLSPHLCRRVTYIMSHVLT